MKKTLIMLIVITCFSTGAIAQIDAIENQSAIGLGKTLYTFTYQGNTIAHYGLGWFRDYQNTESPMAYLSGHGGIKFFTTGANRVFISGTGDMGIGTSNPLAKLEVNNGTILVRNYSNTDGNSAIMIAHSINETNYSTFGTSLRTITQNAGSNVYGLQFFTQESYATGQTEKMRINGNGNVGIGTTSPTEKLSVNGKIRAKEIKVESANWPDYVFAKNYKLTPLQETEEFIKEHKHLPEMPSEAEVKAEGISLGEMNAKLLKKIEELTLHLIEQDKTIKEQQEQLSQQQRNMEQQEQRLNQLENFKN